jgi:sugar O-acyltransferase (sialic acid O-acetyltransferase NeuD family)
MEESTHKKVILIGGKGSCVDIAEEIEDARVRYGMNIEVLGFAFDDPSYAKGINGWPVLCGTKEAWDKYKQCKDVYFIFGMFRYDIARERFALRDSYGISVHRYLTFVHPTAYISRTAQIGHGTIVLANATIKNNVVIGTCNFINSNVNIDHDCVIGNDNFFAAHTCLGSAITVGNRNFFGLNSSVRTPSVIGDYNRIGMCSNVLNSIDDNLVMIGNPAKPLIKKNNERRYHFT